MPSRQRAFILTFVVAILFFALTAGAASITATRGDKVLINLEGSIVSVGEQFFLINPSSQKKAAIIQVEQLKGQKAIGRLIKGRAQLGFVLQPKSSALTGSPSSSDEPPQASQGLRPQYGFLFGLMQNSMTANINYSDNVGATSTTSASMTGMGYSLGGFYDYVLNPRLFFEGVAAYEQFDVSGTASLAACSDSTECNAKISYLSLYGLFKWYVDTSSDHPWWLGGGAVYMLALSKSATALNTADIKVNQALIFAGGMDFALGQGRYIPVSLQYNLFPSSSTVNASSIVVKAGYSFSF